MDTIINTSIRLIIVSGRSGSGKSTALHILEDMGYYCVDNLPIGLLPNLINQVKDDKSGTLERIGVGVDARNLPAQLAQLPKILTNLRKTSLKHDILYLDADSKTLLQRFSETRRKHPLSGTHTSLAEAINKEQTILDSIAANADLTIDTTHLSINQLRDVIRTRLPPTEQPGLSLLFYSFAFKRGIPVDADLVFDVRCLPNPHWVQNLRHLTGKDKAVIKFLSSQELVQTMLTDIQTYLDRWLPKFEENSRSYMTVGIGCTGGQHRSVYIAEALKNHYLTLYDKTQVRHREINL